MIDLNDWISLPVVAGRPEVKARLREVPEKGPFIIVSQFDADRFERVYPAFDFEKVTIKDKFETQLGHVTYYLTLSGKVVKVGYHFDTSD